MAGRIEEGRMKMSKAEIAFRVAVADLDQDWDEPTWFERLVDWLLGDAA